MSYRREFSAIEEHQYNRSNSTRWIISHLLKYKYYFVIFSIAAILANMLIGSLIPLLTGAAFDAVSHGEAGRVVLTHIVLTLLSVSLLGAIMDLSARLLAEILGKRIARDARNELYLSLLGKSQTFHNRQRVGDLMARASNDIATISMMIVSGFDAIFDSCFSIAVVLISIAFLDFQLLLVPLLFLIAFLIALRHYSHTLNPVSKQMRAQLGTMSAVLNEAMTGIEVVKATAQEQQEHRKFASNATLYRDYFVRNGQLQGRYLPTLLIAFALAGAFLHALFLVLHQEITIGTLVAYIGLIGILRSPTYISLWTFSLVQLGMAGAERILNLMKEETEMDENENGYQAQIDGDIVFEHVSFRYGKTPVLKDISFHADPGQTIAIVGQTGTGKSSLTKLINRIYDVEAGRVLIDGVDVRAWNLDALRSQVSTIEQDVFLFSRSIAENIAYGLGQKADQTAIEQAAKDAQADHFIRDFKDGYDTKIGERGVTLSGGQRQRIAIARALLTDPRILLLDDSTSAIDSATEDEIQKAIRRVQQGRTTLLITHRLSQIRWADKILFLRKGELIDQGTHDELMMRCPAYRRIFPDYDSPQTTVLSKESSKALPDTDLPSTNKFPQRGKTLFWSTLTPLRLVPPKAD